MPIMSMDHKSLQSDSQPSNWLALKVCGHRSVLHLLYKLDELLVSQSGCVVITALS